MPRWFPAKPGSGCCVSLPWDHGPAPHWGSWPHSQSGRGWALVQCSRPGAGQRQWEGQKDSPCSLHRHSPAAQPCGSQPCARTLCSTAPWPHQHLLAAATPGSPVPPFLVLTVFSASSTMPYQHPAPWFRLASQTPMVWGNTGITGAAHASPAPAGASAGDKWVRRAREGTSRRHLCGRVEQETGGHRPRAGVGSRL